jgi:chemotaxis protein methyltransferase CheR
MTETKSLHLTDSQFELFKELVKRECGIELKESKRAVFVHRLTKRIREKGLSSFEEYYDYVMNPLAGKIEMDYLLDAITTNKTSFFREEDHFIFMQNVILPIMEQRRLANPNFFLRIWCAGCSSGEEAYSIAMTLIEYFGRFRPNEGRILATDLSEKSIAKALSGTYRRKDISGLSSVRRRAFFERIEENGEVYYSVSKYVRNLIEFHRFNLVGRAYPFRHKFDIIFCRNVLMFLDIESKKKIIQRFYDNLKVGGYFITGMAENYSRLHPGFTQLKNSIFLKE